MSRFKKISAAELIDMLKGRHYRYAQVHHTYKPNHGNFNGSNHVALQQGMFNYHTGTRGWSDIGQHVTLYPDGTFVTGRNFNIAPAGIKGYNTGSFMIEMIGNFDRGNDLLRGEQLKSALKIYNYLVNECDSKVLFHREHAAKTCPGTGINKQEFILAVLNFDGNTKTVDVEEKVASEVKEKQSSWTKVTGKWTGQTLGNGEYGEPVKQLQTMLADNKFYPNKGAKNNGIDSYYGDNTEDAVRRYQQYHGLLVDGLAGKEVYGSLTGGSTAQKNTSSGIYLIVDGKWGEAVNEALQRYFKTPLDGVLSGQSSNHVTGALYGGVDFGSGGSLVVKALQRKLGVKADGLLGPATIRALQRYLGTPVDGKLSRPSMVVKELQRRLNAGTF